MSAKTAYITPGSPWESGYVESFNARLRDELLDGEIFYTLREAQIVIESWRRHFNPIRPHESLGYKPPAPEVFVPAFAAWAAALRRPAPPATLRSATANSQLTFHPDHSMGADHEQLETVKIGAGGYLTGMDIAPDSTMVVRTDTYGAYIWNGTQWQQLVTSTSMPAADVSAEPYGEGVYEIKIAPSNTSIIYMEYKGGVYRSADKGATWTKTAFAHVADGPE